MVRITKVYTRHGDQGQTQLAGGHAIMKSSQRIGLIGELDEFNSHLGLVLLSLRSKEKLQYLHDRCIRLQNEIFNLGAQIAVLAEDVRPTTPSIKQDNVTLLEHEIDDMNQSLPVLESFILPGGGEVSVHLHLARSVCRRAERAMVVLMQESENPSDSIALVYLNRLSDWLFVAARYAALQLNEKEILWQ